MSDLKNVLAPHEWRELQAKRLLEKATKGEFMKPFHEWLKDISPEMVWDWAHLIYIQEHLQAVVDGRIKKLMIFAPPRHGKSEMTTLRFPVYWLEKNPAQRIIVAAYNQTLANKFSRKIRKLTSERIPLNAERRAMDDWETEAGGGCRAIGVGAGIAGVGGNLIVIDDPVRSRRDASSETIRNNTYDWYTDDIFTRFEPDGAIVIINTRWHEDDLSGRILATEDDWTVISLPALAEPGDPLGRDPGEALCPDRFTVDQLLKIKSVMGRAFEALYQQRPVEQEGGMFKRTWFHVINQLPEHGQFDFVRFWDKAATEGGDYTAGVLMARDKKTENYYIVDVIRGQWSPHVRDVNIVNTAEKDSALYGNVKIRHELEPGSSGIDAARSTDKLLVGYSTKAIRSTGSKVVRAEPFQAQCEAGNVYLLKRPWNMEYINELTSFPSGANDDQVDASSGAFNELVKGRAFILVGGQFAS